MFKDLKSGHERGHPDEQTFGVSMHDYVDCYRSTKYDKYDLSGTDASGASLTSPEAL